MDEEGIVTYLSQFTEEQIAKSAGFSYEYAMRVLDEERFPLGEPAILTQGWATYFYAKNILGRRWHEAEAEGSALRNAPDWWDSYCNYIMAPEFGLKN